MTEGGWHTYWHYGLRVVEGDPAEFAKALRAEGIGCGLGYIGKPIFLCMESLVAKRTFGTSSYPFDGSHGGRSIDYVQGMCPRTEEILGQMLVLSVHEHMSRDDITDMAAAVNKVAEALAARRKG